MSEQFASMTPAERKAAAGDPATEPELLRELAGDWRLISDLASNPSTPDDVRASIAFEFPHMRAEMDPQTELDRAFALLRPKAPRPQKPLGPARRQSSVNHDSGDELWSPAYTFGVGVTAILIWFGAAALLQVNMLALLVVACIAIPVGFIQLVFRR